MRLVRKAVPASSAVARIAAAVGKVMGTRGAVHRGSESDMGEPRAFFPTGAPGLDKVLDRKGRGWPMGRLVEVYGGPATVKTGLGYALLAAVQKAGGIGILYPAEGNVDLWLARRYGVDVDQLVVVEPELVGKAMGLTVEQFTDATATALREEPDLPTAHVLDSIAGLTTRDELAAVSAGDPMRRDRSAQVRALLLSATMRRLGAWVPKTNSIIFCINQTRDDPDATYGEKTKPVGGKAIKFQATIRLRLTIIGKRKVERKGKKVVTGVTILATAEKNRLAAPFQEGRFRLDFDRGLLPVDMKKKGGARRGKAR